MKFFVRDIMYKVFTSFEEETDILEAARILLEKKISGAPVINSKREAIGFLSEKDCLKFTMDLKYYNSEPGKVRDYMFTGSSL